MQKDYELQKQSFESMKSKLEKEIKDSKEANWRIVEEVESLKAQIKNSNLSIKERDEHIHTLNNMSFENIKAHNKVS